MFATASDFIKARRRGLRTAEYRRFQLIFDSEFYVENNPDVHFAAVDPERHYCLSGWREGRNPSRDFHTIWYLHTYDDAADSGLNPLLHYAKFGTLDNRATSPPAGDAMGWLPKAAVNMRLPAQLRAHVRDLMSRVCAATTSPADQASDVFPSSEANDNAPADVISRLAPTAQIIDDFNGSTSAQHRAGTFASDLVGLSGDPNGPCGAFPSSGPFDNGITHVSLPAIPIADAANAFKPLHDFQSCEKLCNEDLNAISRGFDEVFYRQANPYLDFSATSPLEHYAISGWRAGRDPSAGFSTNGYLQRYPDVRAADMNPLLHFVLFGKAEGRICLPIQREVSRVDGICEWEDYQQVSSFAADTLEGFKRDVAIIVDFTVALAGEALENVIAGFNFAPPTSENVLISIIIPCLNSELLTIECLQSIANALPKAFAVEVIVADNASEDPAYLALSHNATICHIRFDKNQGFGPACNAAAREASGKYLFFLNNDAQIAPGCLEALAVTADSALVGTVGPKLVSFDGSLQEAGCILNQDGTGTLIGFGRDPWSPRYNYARPVEHVSGAAMLIARDLFFKLGGFDDAYAPAYCEDADLSLKVRNSGLLVMYEPKALVAHHLSATTNAMLTEGQTKRQRISRNRHELIKRWGQDLSERNLRSVAFYLPQYHPIPENDMWWGKGFTEWSNVTKAKPNYVGHNQPRFPADLGYYDLRVSSVMDEQAALAKRYGITGFCYFYYWFDGKRLLHDPLERMLSTGKPDLPFCLCWANENWTRRWDGQESEVLLRQRYSESSALGAIADIARYLRSELYIKIYGKPLILIYRIRELPNPKRAMNTWRNYCRQNGVGEICIAMVESFGLSAQPEDPSLYGCDITVEFPAHGMVHDEKLAVEPISSDWTGEVHDYRKLAGAFMRRVEAGFPRLRSVLVGWDNTPRYPTGSLVLEHSSPGAFQAWLEWTYQRTLEQNFGDQRIVFLLSWNEWCEGSYLEPDRQFGHSYLQAVRNALDTVNFGGGEFAV